MGVRISPGDAEWSYSGFGDFRRRLANEEGFDLGDMKGFGGDREWHTSNGDRVTTLEPLLNHSDCDGYLSAYEAELVAPRLESILGKWAQEGTDYDVEHGRNLLASLRHSIEHGCAVVFS